MRKPWKKLKKKTKSLIQTADKSLQIDQNLSNMFIMQVYESYDPLNKGIGRQPKFPHATSFDTLLDISRINHNLDAKRMAEEALTAIAKGGIYDQVEGGFYRYATDEAWMIPHFEKMLYTNAYKMSANKLFKKVMDETIENIYARFEHDALFYSASDADSDKVEGKYFVFEYEETQKEVLLSIRAKRDYPFIDNKVQTSWNSLFIHALFKAGEKDKALQSLDALVKNLYLKDELYHQMLIGRIPKVKAYLDDYAFLTSALIDAYQATLDEAYLTLAKKLNEQSIKKFYKERQWHMSDDSFKSIAELHDASYRSSIAVSIENILKLAYLSDDYDAYDLASKMLNLHATKLNQISSAMPYATKVAFMLERKINSYKSE